ncbi:MAG: hypothetical protein ACLQUZ_15475 [Rhizomicrobium sp.]
MSNDIVPGGTEVLHAALGQIEARVGENGELYLPLRQGGFTSLGLRPGSTVYISLSPPYAGQAYAAMGQQPIIIVSGDAKKTEEKKPEKRTSEVYKRL